LDHLTAHQEIQRQSNAKHFIEKAKLNNNANLASFLNEAFIYINKNDPALLQPLDEKYIHTNDDKMKCHGRSNKLRIIADATKTAQDKRNAVIALYSFNRGMVFRTIGADDRLPDDACE